MADDQRHAGESSRAPKRVAPVGGNGTGITFYVVPVILFADTGIRGLFEESARPFRGVWGESLTASLGIDLLPALAFVVTLAAIVGIAAVSATGILDGLARSFGDASAGRLGRGRAGPGPGRQQSAGRGRPRCGRNTVRRKEAPRQ